MVTQDVEAIRDIPYAEKTSRVFDAYVYYMDSHLNESEKKRSHNKSNKTTKTS